MIILSTQTGRIVNWFFKKFPKENTLTENKSEN
jgi:hypothetical protein